LFKPKGQKFAVTAKGGDRSRLFIEVQILRLYGTVLVLTLAAIGWAFYGNVHGDTILYGSPNLFWSWYNIFILAIICVVSIELPRLRRAARFDTGESVGLVYGGREHRRNLINLSTSGARVEGPPPLPDGAEIILNIHGVSVKARIVRGDAKYFAICFEDTLENRIAMTRIVFSGRYNNGIETVSAAKVGRAVSRRVFQ
jgi:cellulose synthase (UDP-forming)